MIGSPVTGNVIFLFCRSHLKKQFILATLKCALSFPMKHMVIVIRLILHVFLLGVTVTGFSQNEKYADSLRAVLNHTEGTHYIEISLDLCKYYMNSNPELALSYAFVSLNAAFRNKDDKAKILAYNLSGMIYNNLNLYDSAFVNFSKSISLAYQARDTLLTACILNNIGFLNYRLCNYTEALTNFNQALTIYEQAGDSSSMGSIYNNIGLIYIEIKEFRQALHYFHKALAIGRRSNLPELAGPSIMNIGCVYTRVGEPAKALQYLDSALTYSMKTNNKFNEARIYKEKGTVFITLKDYDRALGYLDQAEEINLKYKIPTELALISELQSECYMALDSLDKALSLARKGLRYAGIVANKKYLVKAYKNLSEIYDRKQDYHEAFRYFRQSIEINDEILDQQKISQIYNIQMQQETSRNAGKIEELKQQKQLQDRQIERQKLIMAIVVIISFFTVIVAFLLYKYYMNRQSMKLAAEMHAIREQRLREVLEAENRERKRIGEELHESLSQVLHMAKLTLSSLNIKDPALTPKQAGIIHSAINLINTAFEELRNISHNLTPFLLKEKGLTSVVNEMLIKIGKTNNCVVSFEEVGFENRLDSFLETNLYRVIQEIFGNILRHAGATEINCQFVRTDKDLTIMIEDNGKGFDVGRARASDGIGILNIYSRIENLNGTVLIDSVLGRGTIITIIVPLTNRLKDGV